MPKKKTTTIGVELHCIDGIWTISIAAGHLPTTMHKFSSETKAQAAMLRAIQAGAKIRLAPLNENPHAEKAS